MKLNFKVAFPKEKKLPSFTKRGPFQRRLHETCPDPFKLWQAVQEQNELFKTGNALYFLPKIKFFPGGHAPRPP